MALEFYNRIKLHAEKIPDHPAIIDGDCTLTYSELLEQIEKFSGGFGTPFSDARNMTMLLPVAPCRLMMMKAGITQPGS